MVEAKKTNPFSGWIHLRRPKPEGGPYVDRDGQGLYRQAEELVNTRGFIVEERITIGQDSKVSLFRLTYPIKIEIDSERSWFVGLVRMDLENGHIKRNSNIMVYCEYNRDPITNFTSPRDLMLKPHCNISAEGETCHAQEGEHNEIQEILAFFKKKILIPPHYDLPQN